MADMIKKTDWGWVALSCCPYQERRLRIQIVTKGMLSGIGVDFNQLIFETSWYGYASY